MLEPKQLSNTGLHRRPRLHLVDLCSVSWMRLLLATLLHRIQNCSGNLEPGDHIIFWYRCCWDSFDITAAYWLAGLRGRWSLGICQTSTSSVAFVTCCCIILRAEQDPGSSRWIRPMHHNKGSSPNANDFFQQSYDETTWNLFRRYFRTFVAFRRMCLGFPFSKVHLAKMINCSIS